MGPTWILSAPRWAPCWPHDLCYQGTSVCVPLSENLTIHHDGRLIYREGVHSTRHEYYWGKQQPCSYTLHKVKYWFLHMMASSNGNIFPHNWPFVQGIYQSLVNSLHKGQWGGALMFSLICAWRNSLANNGDAGDLRCHHAHYDVIVMLIFVIWTTHVLWTIFQHFRIDPLFSLVTTDVGEPVKNCTIFLICSAGETLCPINF